MNIGLAVIAARDARARCPQGGGAIVRVRILVALSVCLAARAALAAACNGGSCPAANLIVSNVTSPQSAGTVSSVRVEARTSNGATATLYAGKIHFTSTDPMAVLPADYTFTSADQGVHVFMNGVVLKTAGTQSVTATDTKTATITGSQTGIQVVSNAVATLVVSGYPASAAAGTTATVTVEARDATGSRATGYTGMVHFASSDVRAVLPADYGFSTGTTCTPSPCDNGIHSFSVTLKTSGAQSVTATDTITGTITGTQSGISMAAGPAASLSVSGFPSPVTAGSAGTATIEARDAFGNRATSYGGTVQLTSTDPVATVPSPVSFAGAQGIQTVAGVTFRTAGSQSLIAADSGAPSIAGRQDGISVKPGSAAGLSVQVAAPAGSLAADVTMRQCRSLAGECMRCRTTSLLSTDFRSGMDPSVLGFGTYSARLGRVAQIPRRRAPQ